MRGLWRGRGRRGDGSVAIVWSFWRAFRGMAFGSVGLLGAGWLFRCSFGGV